MGHGLAPTRGASAGCAALVFSGCPAASRRLRRGFTSHTRLLVTVVVALGAALQVAAGAVDDPVSGGASFVSERPAYVEGRVLVKLKTPTVGPDGGGAKVLAAAASADPNAAPVLPGLSLGAPLGLGAAPVAEEATAFAADAGARAQVRIAQQLAAVSRGEAPGLYNIQDGSTVEQKVQELKGHPDVEWAVPDRLWYPQVLDPSSQAAQQAEREARAAMADATAARRAGGHRKLSSLVADAAGQEGPQAGSSSSGSGGPMVRRRGGARRLSSWADGLDDEYWSQLWFLREIGAPFAWQTTQGSKQVGMCIIDTGMQRGHPDLPTPVAGWKSVPNIGTWGQVTGYPQPGDADFNDYNDQQTHGTHVAGIAAAIGNNKIGSAGLAWNIGLHVCRVFDKGDKGASTANIINCVSLCKEAGVKVVSMSLGSEGYDEGYATIARDLNAAGIMLFVAAGNNGTWFPAGGEDKWEYPAGLTSPQYNLDNIVAVGATSPNGALASYSNRGPNVVSLAAPGSYIFSTLPQDSYGAMSGTSMSTPLTAAAAALLFSAAEARGIRVSYRDIKKVLLAGVVPFTDAKLYVASAGQLNVARSMRLLLFNDLNVPAPPPPPSGKATGAIQRFPGVRWWHYSDSSKFFQGLEGVTLEACTKACVQDWRCGKYVYFRAPSFTLVDGIQCNCLLWGADAWRCQSYTCISTETNPNVESGVVTRPQAGPAPLPSPSPSPSPRPRPPSPRPRPPSRRPPPPPSPRPVGKPQAWSSSFLGSVSASRAIDGDNSTFFSTVPERNPWWAADLRQPFDITGVRIKLRSDAKYDLASLHDVEVRAGTTLPPRKPQDPSTINTRCRMRPGRLGARLGGDVVITCVSRIRAQYVTLQLWSKAGVANDVLTFSEVVVTGRPV